MFKVNISNASQNLSWSASFPTELEAQEWLAKQIGKPHRLPERDVPTYDENGLPILNENNEPVMETLPAEFTSEIVDISAQLELESQKAAAKKLLADTDWLIIRELDAGIACPQEIKNQRAAARSIL